MSKLFEKYQNLKKENPEKLYLLKSGIFYIGLDDDAKKLSELFSFKITNLNDTVVKCGFPETKLEFYTNLLKRCNVDFEIINSSQEKVINSDEYINTEKTKEIINSIIKLDMNSISFKSSYEFLNKIHTNLKEIYNKKEL